MNTLLKFAGAGLIIFATTAYGFMKCRDLKLRLEQQKEIAKIIFLLKGEIEFGHTALPEAFRYISKRCHTVFSEILSGFADSIRDCRDSFSVSWRAYMQEKLKCTGLNNQEKEAFIQLGDVLGLNECETQINALSAYEKELNMSIEELTGQLPSRTKVYRSLGITVGVIITIIIV